MVEFHRVVDVVGAVERDKVAAARLAEIDVAVGELERDVLRQLVGKTGVQRPGKTPRTGGAAKGVAAAVDRAIFAVHAGREVAEITDGVAAETDAGADERRKVIPSPEIDITVQQEGPFGLADDRYTASKSE